MTRTAFARHCFSSSWTVTKACVDESERAAREDDLLERLAIADARPGVVQREQAEWEHDG